MSIPSFRQVIKPLDVLLQDLEGEAVLLNLANGQYYGLDGASYHMYETLTSSASIQAAYEILAQEYEVAPGQLKADLERFIADLVEHGLLIYVTGQSA